MKFLQIRSLGQISCDGLCAPAALAWVVPSTGKNAETQKNEAKVEVGDVITQCTCGARAPMCLAFFAAYPRWPLWRNALLRKTQQGNYKGLRSLKILPTTAHSDPVSLPSHPPCAVCMVKICPILFVLHAVQMHHKSWALAATMLADMHSPIV